MITADLRMMAAVSQSLGRGWPDCRRCYSASIFIQTYRDVMMMHLSRHKDSTSLLCMILARVRSEKCQCQKSEKQSCIQHN